MSKPFQVTFTNPDRHEYEVTEIYQAENEDEAKKMAVKEYPDATIFLVQQLHIFRSKYAS